MIAFDSMANVLPKVTLQCGYKCKGFSSDRGGRDLADVGLCDTTHAKGPCWF